MGREGKEKQILFEEKRVEREWKNEIWSGVL
jgi:hypothetical protein